MTQAPTTVWNEVRFTSEGISISLFSESPEDGAIVEDEMWFTYDELQEMAPSEPLSLRMSDESREALSEQHRQAIVGNLLEDDSQQSVESDSRESVETLPTVGDVVRDSNPPSWSEDDFLEVVGISDKSADEYIVQEADFFKESETVADSAPSCDPDEPVIECQYLDEWGNPSGKVYGFPLSRIEETEATGTTMTSAFE